MNLKKEKDSLFLKIVFHKEPGECENINEDMSDYAHPDVTDLSRRLIAGENAASRRCIIIRND